MFNADDPAIPAPPPPQEGENAPRIDSEADLDDDGPGGLYVGDVPVVVDGRGPQRDSHPADKNQKLGLAQLEYRLDRQLKKLPESTNPGIHPGR
eukprot:3651693-Pyramimonas_sp.AAC.1